MLSFGIAKGSNALASQLHLLSTPTSLKANHTKFPKFFVSEFVEEINNDENADETDTDFYFSSLSSCAFAFTNDNISTIIFPKLHYSLSFLNQKINLLNCIFLI